MLKVNNKKGFVLVAVLVAVLILAVLYMAQTTSLFNSGGGEKFDVHADQPWFEEDKLLPEDAFPVAQNGKGGKTVIEEQITLTGSVQRKLQDRGNLEITITSDGKVIGNSSLQYEHPENIYKIKADFSGNIDSTKLYADKDGKNKKLLYFITKGKYKQTKTEKSTNTQWPTEQIVYVVGWIDNDYSAKGKMFLTNSDGGRAEYNWQAKDTTQGQIQMNYIVKKTSASFAPDANWNKPQFKNIESIELANFMGHRPAHFPQTQAKLLYDDEFIYVISKVDDQYVRAVNTEYDSGVCRDSCVEFFFTPSEDISSGYFNLEMNCCGTFLFRHQRERGVEQVTIDQNDANRIEIATTLTGKIESEITEPTEWTVEYKIPFDILTKYAPIKRPSDGIQWRANFYKCGDQTSKPHWLTWNKIPLPKPDFHRPEFFGILEFD